jgi:hypothetical protein
MSAMPWLGIRLAEYEPGATRYASRRQDREPAARHVQEYHQGQVGVPTEAIPDPLEDVSAVEAAVRRAAAAVVGRVDGALWPTFGIKVMMR